jgi:hypothetical protein
LRLLILILFEKLGRRSITKHQNQKPNLHLNSN